MKLNVSEYPLLHELLGGRYSSIFSLIDHLGAGEDTENDWETQELDHEDDLDMDILPDWDDENQFLDEDDSTIGEAEPRIGEVLQADNVADLQVQRPPAGFSNIEVGFSHQRIRDYLDNEGRPSKRRFPTQLTVGIADMNHAELHIALTCLHILCDNSTERFGLELNQQLHDYSVRNFMKHLSKVDLAILDQSEIDKVLRYLYTLFSNVDAYLGWTTPLFLCKDWLSDPVFTHKAQAILEHSTSEFSPGEHAWIQRATGSVKELFRPMVEWFVEKWLMKSGSSDQAYFDKSQKEVWFVSPQLLVRCGGCC